MPLLLKLNLKLTSEVLQLVVRAQGYDLLPVVAIGGVLLAPLTVAAGEVALAFIVEADAEADPCPKRRS